MSFLREILVQTHACVAHEVLDFSYEMLVLDASTAYVQELSRKNLVLVACVVIKK